jgi:hypothetical protein
MAGRGKGALRIAIEDFLESFGWGKVFSSWFVEFGEDQEDAIAAYYDVLIQELPDGVIKDLVRGWTVRSDGDRNAQGAVMSALGFAGSVGVGAASGLLAPWMKLVNYRIERSAKTARIDPASLVQLYWRDPGLFNKIIDDARDLGYDKDHYAAVKEIVRPILAVGDMIPMMYREIINKGGLIETAKKAGWTAGDIDKIIQASEIIPGVGDLVGMAVREAWRDDVAAHWGYDEDFPQEFAKWAGKQGLSADWARRYWRAHWQLPSPSLGFTMYHRLRPGKASVTFTRDNLKELLKIADYPAGFREHMIEIAYSPITRVDLRRLYRVGVINAARVLDGYKDLGYKDADAQALADFAIKDATGAEKDITRAAIVTSYKKAIISRGDAASMLTEIVYSAQEADFYLDIADYEIEVKRVDDVLDYIEFMYVNSEIDAQGVSAELGKLNLPSAQVERLLLVWDIKRRKKQKIPSKTDFEDFYKRDIIDRDQLIDNLKKAGWTGERVGWIVARIDQRIQEDARKEAERAQKEQDRLIASDKAEKYQLDKADIDVQIALRRLDIADLKVAISTTDDPLDAREFAGRIKLRLKEIAELNVIKANVKMTYYGV